MAAKRGVIYEFADFRLVPDDDLLLRSDEPVPLTPKAFSTLVMLVEQHGHLVRKEELIDKVWSDANVEEAAVSRCVWTIRNALGEDSKNQRFIQTVPKRGYKFVGHVSTRVSAVPVNGHRADPHPEPDINYAPQADRVERRSSRRLAIYVGLSLALVILFN